MPQKKTFPPMKLDGFSLIEISLVLIIMGVIIGATMKGRELIESARLNALVMQINNYRMAIQTFHDQYGSLPGDFSTATTSFQGVENGDGDGVITGPGLDAQSDAGKVWRHLSAASLIPSCGQIEGSNLSAAHGVPATKIGGVITLESDPEKDLSGLWLIIGRPHARQNKKGLLTPLQAQRILKKFEQAIPNEGDIRILNDPESKETCILDSGRLNLSHSAESCLLYARVNV